MREGRESAVRSHFAEHPVLADKLYASAAHMLHLEQLNRATAV